jgi:hypothetical protein
MQASFGNSKRILFSTSFLLGLPSPITYLVPWQSSALSRESTRDPRVLVSPVPDGDSNTVLHRLARGDDRLVVCLLLGEQRSRGWQGHTDVELGDSDLDTERRESVHVLLQARAGWSAANNEVALETYTVEWYICRLERLDEVLHRGGLGTGVFDVVVVDVQLRIRVGLAGGLESNLNVGCTEGVVEDVRAPSTVIVEGL